MRLRALAKINLGLDVLGKREDGYHELRMIMQTINMYDQLEIEICQEPGIHISTNLPFIPTNENNLVHKAAKLLMDEFQIAQGIRVELQKFIPVAAGMAGGSSDAAAAMIGVNRLFGLGLSVKELMERGVKVGADVPYCLLRGTALAEGIDIPEKKPTPPDTVFSKALGGWYDIVVVMYHDQGHIPLKVKGFVYNREKQAWDAVAGINVTLGLPIIRASVDHGTGFGHAGSGHANELSLKNAMDYAIQLANAKKNHAKS